MPEAYLREIQIYETPDGKRPFSEWLESLRNINARAKIRVRLDRVEVGNLGDYRAVGKGVCELRIDYGPGYRVYFGQIGITVILLLCGGDKAVKTKISTKLLNTGQTMETDKMPKSVSYHAYLIESLKDPFEASAYFKAVLEEGDVEMLQKAINNLIEAGYNNLAIGLNLQNLNNSTLLSTIATKIESQNLFQIAEFEIKQRVK